MTYTPLPTDIEAGDPGAVAYFNDVSGAMNKVARLSTGGANCSGTTTLGGSSTPVTGATVTFTAPVDGYALVVASFDFTFGAVEDLLIGQLLVDASPHAAVVIAYGTIIRLSVGRQWLIPLAAGSHTLALAAYKVSGSGTCTAGVDHTGLSYVFIPTV